MPSRAEGWQCEFLAIHIESLLEQESYLATLKIRFPICIDIIRMKLVPHAGFVTTADKLGRPSPSCHDFRKFLLCSTYEEVVAILAESAEVVFDVSFDFSRCVNDQVEFLMQQRHPFFFLEAQRSRAQCSNFIPVLRFAWSIYQCSTRCIGKFDHCSSHVGQDAKNKDRLS